MNKPSTRRSFLAMGGRAAGASFLAANLPMVLAMGQAAADAVEHDKPFQSLDVDEAHVLSAVADQIFPPDEQPGASDLGAVHFIDGAVSGFMAGAWPMIRSGCAELDQASRASEGVGFSELGFEEQTTMLQAREETPFFGAVHFLTIAGVFASPVYGGNRDRLGWKLLGFEPRHAWQPPFGYYDAEVQGEHDHASG